MPRNKNVYDIPAVAADYARQSHLQPAERTILRLMLPGLPAARMLDLGVGGGRTTVHFASKVREYVGTDYSESMIMECRKRFAGCPPHISFRVCDARVMDLFEAQSFDFILFSHNGIDYVSHEDRLRILKEIQRVGKPGGSFCFSTHNLNWCANLFDFRRMISLNPKSAWPTAKRLILRFFYNPGMRMAQVRKASYIVFNDGAHHGKLQTHYIRPLEQIAELQAGFSDVRVLSTVTGREISDPSELGRIEEPWLYYLCNIKTLG
jgi:ubiquinone/menaquinone biosynthesis C-methylase UbiE